MGRGAAAVAVALLAALGAVAVPPSPARGADEVSLVPLPALGYSGHAGLYGWGAATMRDGSVLVGDYWNMRVLRYAADGTPLGVFIENAGFQSQQHQAPYGLAVDPDNGDVYLADTDRRQVDRYSESGTYLRSYGTNGVVGETPTTFRYPSRVAVAGGLLFVADTWAHRISVWDRNGTEQLFEQKGFGSQDGQLRQPRGMAFDAQGRLHVVNSGNKRIEVFSVDRANRRLVFEYRYGSAFVAGDPNPAPGAVIRGDMRGLAIDKSAGVAYVVDGEGNRVHTFTVGGEYLRTWGGASTFSDGGREATVDHQGRVWVGDMPGFRVQVFSPTGEHLFNRPNPPQPPPPGGFNGPRGAAVDPVTGNVYVSDTYNFRIQKLSPNGTMLAEWGTRGRGDYEFNYTRLIAVDPRDSSVIVADTDNHRIKKYAADGTFLWQIGANGTGPLLFKNPHGIDIGPDGTIYVADTNNARVQVLNADGTHRLTFGSLGSADGQFRRPRGVVTDDTTGEIYVADAVRDNVQVFSPAGTYLRTIGATSPVPLGGPFDVAVEDGYLYVADTPRNVIAVFGTDGRWVGEFGGGGTAPGRLLQPQGLDLVDGILYIAEQKNERISRWQVQGGSAVPDTTAPSVTMTSPSANQTLTGLPVLIGGSATDEVGVAQVQVAVRDRDRGMWWNVAQQRWQSGVSWRIADLTSAGATATDWQLAFSDAADPGSGNYYTQHRGLDAAGNTSATSGSRFQVRSGSVDTVAPTSTVTSPTNNHVFGARPVLVQGTAADNQAVSRVEVAVQDRSTKRWWNPNNDTWRTGRLFTDATLASPGAATTTWQWSFDDTPDPGSGDYLVQRRAVDVAGNRGAVSGTRFSLG